MISSLDELAVACVDETSRLQIMEAISCYQSGAYRAAIVTAYVAVCFDLIQKLRNLAASGDGEAKTAVVKLEMLQEKHDRNDPQAIKGLLEFERRLLEEFRDKFDFFGRNEFDDLERLRTDRNRCAHPTFLKNALPFTPSAEQARLHIRNAMVLVLTQQPKQGKAALESLQALILSSYFPAEIDDAVTRLKGSELQNAKQSLITGFVDLICFGWPDRKSPLFHKRPTLVALLAALEIHREKMLPRLIRNVNRLLMETDASAVNLGGFLAVRIVDVGEKIEEAGRPIVKSWLTSPERKSELASVIKRALGVEWLKDKAEAICSTLNAEDFGSIEDDVPPQIATAAAKLYASATDWNKANEYASRFAIRYAGWFSTSDLEIIFAAAGTGKADLAGSHGFREFVDTLLLQDAKKKTEVVNLLNEHGLERFTS
jgi:hypothetical protein